MNSTDKPIKPEDLPAGAFGQMGPEVLESINFANFPRRLPFVFGHIKMPNGEITEAVLILPHCESEFADEEAFKAQTPLALLRKDTIQEILVGWDRNREWLKENMPDKPALSIVKEKLH